ncbi:bacteriophage/transposase fusion protein [Burkholderia pseudomallei]|nr:integrase [Burkholderia pseudomallei]ALC02070.1 integrase [Burkholderia pseudomallei]CAJ5883559.1 bacteriophage/transposase fusion protein [Burkholderia pseudomallei]
MKRLFLILILAPTMFLAAGCDNVPAGYVGVKVQRYGDDRGVNVEVKGPGRYFNGPNVDMFIFPTFTQSYVWDKAGKSDESFTFQTVEGLSVNTDIGVSYAIPRENAPKVFQKYRRGVDEITGVYLRAIVRDALNLAGASMAVEDVYGRGKAALQQRVEDEVKANAAKVGISVEKVYFVNQMRLPEQVMNSISGKIAATQIAQQKENELRAAEADAAKQVAIAKGEAEALEVKAKALRENSQILQQMAIEKWDGKLPQYARRVVGWAFSQHADTDLALKALRRAYDHRRPPPGLMFHSDQGCQYTSTRFLAELRARGTIQSMSRRGNCWDNAVVERFFRSLKNEWIGDQLYVDHRHAEQDITDYLVDFYNHRRLHSAAKGLS